MQTHCDDGHKFNKIVYTEKQISDCVKKLADEINRDYRDKENIIIVGILKGAFMFVSDLLRHIDFPVKLTFATISSYGADKIVSAGPQLLNGLDINPKDAHVLVAEDIIDSGLTLNYCHEWLLQLGAKTVETVVLLDIPRNVTKRIHKPKYVGFVHRGGWVCGYGVD